MFTNIGPHVNQQGELNNIDHEMPLYLQLKIFIILQSDRNMSKTLESLKEGL